MGSQCVDMSNQNETSNDVTTTTDERIDEQRRRFLIKSACVLGGLGAVCATIPLVSSLVPSRKTLVEGAPLRVDISHLAPGEQITVIWRGKPVWIVRRTATMVHQLNSPSSDLRDPLSLAPQQPLYAKNKYRSIKPEYLVLIGVCTHLGCIPHYELQQALFYVHVMVHGLIWRVVFIKAFLPRSILKFRLIVLSVIR